MDRVDEVVDGSVEARQGILKSISRRGSHAKHIDGDYVILQA